MFSNPFSINFSKQEFVFVSHRELLFQGFICKIDMSVMIRDPSYTSLIKQLCVVSSLKASVLKHSGNQQPGKETQVKIITCRCGNAKDFRSFLGQTRDNGPNYIDGFSTCKNYFLNAHS